MTADRVRVACVQPSSGQDFDDNLRVIGDLVRRARDQGAEFITMPENCSLMEHRTDVVQSSAVSTEDHPAISAFADLARETGAWLLVGSIAARSSDGRIANRSVLLDAEGGIVATYDKIHMFDVDLPTGENYRESDVFRPGDKAVIAETPWGLLGMSVCYDLRFAPLYRTLAKAGATMLSVPAAFTKHTGEAHWHLLLRARAVETGSFVIAPCMWGEHSGGRATYGHSLIVDPWGVVLADAGEGVGMVTADLDLAKVAEARNTIPALQHDRPFAHPAVAP